MTITRFLNTNFLATAVSLTATHRAPTAFSGIIAANAGSATLQRRGTYTGTIARNYRIEIENVTGDGNFGSGSRWRWSDTGGATWNETNKIALALIWTTLSFGVQVRWTYGPALPQLVLGDAWAFQAKDSDPPGNAVDGIRDSDWRTGALVATDNVDLTADLGTPKTPTVVAILDHDIPSTTTIREQSSSTSDFASLIHDQVIPWASSKILADLTNPSAARYWRLRTTYAGPVSAQSISEVYLGTVTDVPAFHHRYGSPLEEIGSVRDLDESSRGPVAFGRLVQPYEVTFTARTQAQRLVLEDVFRGTRDAATGQRNPVILVPSAAVPEVPWGLFHWETYDPEHRFGNVYHVHARFSEVVRSGG